FALMDCELSSGVYSLPFVDLDSYGYEGVSAQNGYLALSYLFVWYHKHNLPTYSININAEDTIALSIKRTKVQEIEFASFDFDPMQLITTGLGTGQISEFTQNLHSGAIKGKIKHSIT
ncbi:MAG: hypothetical protein GY787_23100, partial [Alteromonadales bacterium]|nr:hypothetical protein [Alteromonadales bacterium]